MTFISVAWKPQAALSKDLKLGLQMQPVPAAAIEQAQAGAPPCEHLFNSWVVENTFPDQHGGTVVPRQQLFSENSATPIVYPEGCWQFQITAALRLCEGECLEWSATLLDGSDLPIISAGFSLTLVDAVGDPSCRAVRALWSNLAFPDGFMIGSTMVLRAFVAGEQFGPDIWFACDVAAYADVWESWTQSHTKADVDGGGFDASTTYKQVPLPVPAVGNPESFRIQWGSGIPSPTNFLWSNVNHVLWTVTQTAGPAFANPTFPKIVGLTCASWIVIFEPNYDYSGTSFSAQASIAAVDVGAPVTYQCAV